MSRAAALGCLLFASALLSLLVGCRPAPPPTIAELLARVDAVEEPGYDPTRRGEPGYEEIFLAARRHAASQRAELLLAAARFHPEDSRVPELLDRRWDLLARTADRKTGARDIIADVERVLDEIEHPQIARHGAYWRSLATALLADADSQDVLTAATGFCDAYPDDPRGALLLQRVVDHPSTTPEDARIAWQRTADDYPRSYWAPYAPGQIRRIDAAGEPFELDFRTFRTGRQVTSGELDGKVVVLDFWATTCAPCVAALPEMRRLYAEYRDRGVEFVGISLDESDTRGGRAAVERFLETYEIPWPIWYQGNGYHSDLSLSWGVGAIPEVFLLDRNGRLVTTEARNRLAELIPELL